MSSPFEEYLYLVVLSLIFGFFMAFGIGANDCANSFGSSVSAGSLTLLQAVLLGSLMEFSGSILLGASVAGTVRGKVIDASFYEEEPEVYMLGCTTGLMAASSWLFIATAWQYPVSTTHDILAALIGFSIAAHGFQSIVWSEASKIFISWFAAPIISGLFSYIFFMILKKLVLQSEHVFERALKVFPVVVFCAITIDLFFILFKADNNSQMEEWDWGHKVVLPGALGGGTLSALLTYFVFVPRIRKKVDARHDEAEDVEEEGRQVGTMHMVADDDEESEVQSVTDDPADGWKVERTEEFTEATESDTPTPKKVRSSMKVKKTVEVAEPEPAPQATGVLGALNWVADNTFRQDLRKQSFHESSRAEEIWAEAEVYDRKVEHLFSYLQVFTACLAAFAHGANDVANAIAPISAVIDIYNTGEFNEKAPVQKWLLAMGGFAISLGFAIFGYKIIKAVGYKLTMITPSRGFCIELAAAFAVSVASFLSIPVSTTQCLIGATTGVGLASGGSTQVDFKFLLRVTSGWVIIFFVAAVFNAGFFAFTAYSPSLIEPEIIFANATNATGRL